MIRVLIVMLGLLLAGHSVEAAPWTLPAGIKTLEVNGYPMAFLESGTGESIVLVHGAGTDYRSWARQVESPPWLSAHCSESPPLLSGTLGWQRRHVFHKTAR